MIKGFEEQTQPLTEYEEKILTPVVARGLERKIGSDSAVTNSYIVDRLRPRYKVDGPRLRKVINHIRVNGIVPGLIATKTGYYVATTAEEIDSYAESLKGREDAIRSVRLSIERQRRVMFPAEKSLFDL